MYFLWWSKPVDVTTSVRIYRLTSPIPHPPAISIARDGATTSVRIYPPTIPFSQSPEISIERDGDSVLTPSEMLDFESPPSSLDICIRKSIHTTGYPVTIHETGSSGGLYSSLCVDCVMMSPADQISLMSSTPIPQVTTSPITHALPSSSDSIHLDPELESRCPPSQKILASYKREW